MLNSAEVRWFLPLQLKSQDKPSDSEIFKSIYKWFSGGKSLNLESSRIDDYLIFPDSDSVGVKIRQKKLEIKAIQTASRPFSVTVKHDGQLVEIKGRTDQWVKWSLDLVAGLKKSYEGEQLDRASEAVAITLKGADSWFSVSKDRYLRKFSADVGTMEEVTVSQRPDKGCNVELTIIIVKSDPSYWLTFGFEAFSPLTSETPIILDKAIRLFFETHGTIPAYQLNQCTSLNYSAWMSTLTAIHDG